MSHDDAHDRGLPYDLGVLLSRRKTLGGLAAAGAAAFVSACDGLFANPEPEVSAVGADGKTCVVHPTEIAGPFPADGSNRAHGTLANVLRDTGIVRRDMRPNLQPGLPPAEGAELELTVALVSVGGTCTPLADHAVYLWHCDAAGNYSIYDRPGTSYLRGVGVSDASGHIAFTTIVPGCYAGRFPHMHFEVYPSLAAATDYKNRLLTSQLVVPGDICGAVYKSQPAYAPSIPNFAKSPLDRDMIFADNTPGQLAAQTLAIVPKPGGGYAGSVTIGLKV